MSETKKETTKVVQQVETDKLTATGKKDVTVITTDSAPYHKANLEINVTEFLAEKMVKNGWAKLKK